MTISAAVQRRADRSGRPVSNVTAFVTRRCLHAGSYVSQRQLRGGDVVVTDVFVVVIDRTQPERATLSPPGQLADQVQQGEPEAQPHQRLAERQQRRSWSYYAWAPALATCLVVIGSMLVLIEGLICAIVIVPLFTFMGMAGGLCMGLVCRLTRWPRHAAYGFAVLPLAAALVLPQGAPAQVGQVERSLWINAPAAVVWQGINDIRNIQPSEVETSLAYRIGVPPPVEAVTVQEPHGTHVRKIRWGKGVNFDEVIQDWEPGRHLRWTFRFGPDSIPAGALDDHVAIGGAYFDLNDTAYTLTPEAGGTRLHLRISYRLSTDFNTYANWWAQALLDNFALTVLQLYKTRLEGSA